MEVVRRITSERDRARNLGLTWKFELLDQVLIEIRDRLQRKKHMSPNEEAYSIIRRTMSFISKEAKSVTDRKELMNLQAEQVVLEKFLPWKLTKTDLLEIIKEYYEEGVGERLMLNLLFLHYPEQFSLKMALEVINKFFNSLTTKSISI